MKKSCAKDNQKCAKCKWFFKEKEERYIVGFGSAKQIVCESCFDVAYPQ